MELEAMDARCIGNELATCFVSTICPANVTENVLRVLLQLPDVHEGVIRLGFILGPQLDESPVELLFLLA